MYYFYLLHTVYVILEQELVHTELRLLIKVVYELSSTITYK